MVSTQLVWVQITSWYLSDFKSFIWFCENLVITCSYLRVLKGEGAMSFPSLCCFPNPCSLSSNPIRQIGSFNSFIHSHRQYNYFRRIPSVWHVAQSLDRYIYNFVLWSVGMVCLWRREVHSSLQRFKKHWGVPERSCDTC